MDLGISGRKAIVCASSKGLGRRLRRRAGGSGLPNSSLNGRDPRTLAAAAKDIRDRFGVTVHEIARRSQRSGDPEGPRRSDPGSRYSGQ